MYTRYGVRMYLHSYIIQGSALAFQNVIVSGTALTITCKPDSM